tara:strand:+ start:2685 stop:4649 length:1965 start_codon:yes stop_codon:yes gene_type:complete
MHELFSSFRSSLGLKKLLLEISYKDATAALNSKKVKGIIKSYNFERGEDPNHNLDKMHVSLKSVLKEFVPNDLEDNQRGTALLWVIKIIKEHKDNREFFMRDIFENEGRYRDLPGYFWDRVAIVKASLESFFQYQRFMAQQDIFRAKSFDELIDIVESARPAITKYQESKKWADAEAGATVIDDGKSSGIFIAELHNKGAACHYGKGTSWCVSAPGLDYFRSYYREDSPLIFFKELESGKRFLFAYSNNEFMNENNRPIDEDLLDRLHALVLRHGLDKKYKGIADWEEKRAAMDPDTPPEELDRILKTTKSSNTRFNVLRNRSTSIYTLRGFIKRSTDIANIDLDAVLAVVENRRLLLDDFMHFLRMEYYEPNEVLTLGPNHPRRHGGDKVRGPALNSDLFMIQKAIIKHHRGISEETLLNVFTRYSSLPGSNSGVIVDLADTIMNILNLSDEARMTIYEVVEKKFPVGGNKIGPISILSHKNMPADVINKTALGLTFEDPDFQTYVLRLLRHKRASDEALDHILEQVDKHWARRKVFFKGIAWQLADNQEKVFPKLFKYFPIKEGTTEFELGIHKLLASNSNSPIDVLVKLTEHPDWRVRMVIATNNKSNLRIFRILSKDSNAQVVWQAEKRLKDKYGVREYQDHFKKFVADF